MAVQPSARVPGGRRGGRDRARRRRLVADVRPVHDGALGRPDIGDGRRAGAPAGRVPGERRGQADRQRRGQERRHQHIALRPGPAGRDDRADGLARPAHDHRADRGREVAAAGRGGAARGRPDGELDEQTGRRQRGRGDWRDRGHRAGRRHVVAAEPARHHRGGGRPGAAQPGRAGRQLDRAVGGQQQHPPAADQRAEQPAAGHHRVPVRRPRHAGPARIDGQRLGIPGAAGGADPRQPDRRALPAGAADADAARLQGRRPAAERVRPEGDQHHPVRPGPGRQHDHRDLRRIRRVLLTPRWD